MEDVENIDKYQLAPIAEKNVNIPRHRSRGVLHPSAPVCQWPLVSGRQPQYHPGALLCGLVHSQSCSSHHSQESCAATSVLNGTNKVGSLHYHSVSATTARILQWTCCATELCHS